MEIYFLGGVTGEHLAVGGVLVPGIFSLDLYYNGYLKGAAG